MFALSKVRPHIYLLSFDSPYDLAMHFWRVQEFYESPEFKGQHFDLVTYMEWYAKEGPGKEAGAFTYPKDWRGFNVPSEALAALLCGPGKIPDENKYDELMKRVFMDIHHQENHHRFYLLGAKTGDDKTLEHEIAHGMFYVDPGYREEALKLVRRLPAILLAELKNCLADMGYDQSVFEDEINAYMSTGLCEEMQIKAAEWESAQPGDDITIAAKMEPFQELFKEFERRGA